MSELFSPDWLLLIGHKALRLCLIIGGSALVMRFLKLIVDRFFMPRTGAKHFYLEERRARTLSTLLKSIVQYVVYFVALVMILREFQIDTTSILAGAGVIGLAVGFGAQTLVKDVITGFFILFEDQYSVGDYIVSGDMAGTVEDMGFRITKLRGSNGVLHIIPNGSITKVSNHTRGHMLATVNIPVAYDADLRQVESLLKQACAAVKDLPQIIEAPKVSGIVDMRPGELMMRIVAKTLPLEQSGVEAAIRRQVQELFAAAAIPLPAAAQAPVRKNTEPGGGQS